MPHLLILTATAAVVTAAAAATAPQGHVPLQVGDALPRLEGKYLTGRDAVLPDAAGGRTVLLLLGFTYASRVPVEAWGTWFRSAVGMGPERTFYEVPMIGGMAKMGRWFIDRGMRRGTPADLHENVITVYSHVSDWKKRMGVSDANDKHAFVLVLNGGGVIRWLYHGPFDEARAAEARAFFGSTRGPR